MIKVRWRTDWKTDRQTDQNSIGPQPLGLRPKILFPLQVQATQYEGVFDNVPAATSLIKCLILYLIFFYESKSLIPTRLDSLSMNLVLELYFLQKNWKSVRKPIHQKTIWRHKYVYNFYTRWICPEWPRFFLFILSGFFMTFHVMIIHDLNGMLWAVYRDKYV